VGSAATNVDTINELIHSDHHYYKVEPAAPVASVPSNICVVSDSLPTLAPKGLEGLGAKLAFPSSQVVVVSTLAQPPVVHSAPAVNVVAGWNATNFGAGGLGANSKAALATMVDPNVVCAPRSVRSQPSVDTAVPDLTEELDADMWKSLEGLLSLEGLEDFPMDDVKPKEQQETMITESTPAPVTQAKSKGRKRKQSSLMDQSVSPPPACVPSPTDMIDGENFEMVFQDDQAGKLSPASVLSSTNSDLSDSGFSGNFSDNAASPLSECAPSHEGMSDFTVCLDGSGFLEEFGELFPNIAY